MAKGTAIELTPNEGASPEIWALGWTEEQLRDYLPPGGPPTAALTPAVGCDPPLPAPVWTHQVRGEAADPPAAWTATWLVDRCPQLVGDGHAPGLEVCASTHCGQSFRQIGCALEADLGSCGISDSDLGGVVFPNGEICLVDPPAACVVIPTAPDAVASLECAQLGNPCAIDLYSVAESLPVDVARAQIYDAPDYQGEYKTHPTVADARTGFLGGFIVRDGRATALSLESGPTRVYAQVGWGKLVFVDTESLAVVGTATAPRGLSWLRPDPLGDGFLGVYRGPESPFPVRVGRFDADGRLLESRESPPTSTPGFRQVLGFDHQPKHQRFVSLTRPEGARERFVEVLSVAEDLSSFDLCVIAGGVRGRAQAVTEDWLMVSNDRGNDVLYVDPSDCRIVRRTEAQVGDLEFGSVLALEDGSTMVSIGGDSSPNAVLRIDSDDSTTTRGAYYASEGSTDLMFTHPSAPGLIYASVATGFFTRDVTTRLTLIEPDTPRFLPASHHIGDGMVSHGLIDDQGRLWLALNWAGELARITFR